ncbi:hypothetical protein BJG93_22485 [Paraburkholderia sprentiae WSM5005]|uniref:Uncharacterized protein n=1 Tax=Paraburkholderia sprentiae WSM5005 TaxID=754502 RepID=A0A1I9YPC6_9BURK|nr:hypothetical protein [Paraburkholderia sprentiae]APA88159.1 hypothetical protein BJG93_22485 [Paraburkholderia sprentiae WSM5005]
MNQQKQDATEAKDECLLCRVTYSIFSKFPRMPRATALNVERGEFFPQDRLRSYSAGYDMANALGYGWACDCRGRAQQADCARVASSLYGSSPRGPQKLGNAQPFEYSDALTGGDVTVLGARGVSEQQEIACEMEYERNMIACKMLSETYGGDLRTRFACEQRAFETYNQCRGY